jgi:hypothetical protein
MNVFDALFLIKKQIRARNILNVDGVLIERYANVGGVRPHKKFGLDHAILFPLDCPFPPNYRP